MGASVGGLIVQTFAHLWPELTAGIALVDANHPEMDVRLAEIATAERVADEYVHASAEDYARVRARGALPDVPLLVLSAAHNARVAPGWPGEATARVRRALQDRLAGLARRGSRLVVEGCHHIHRERPRLVVEAIHEVIAAAEAGRTPRLSSVD